MPNATTEADVWTSTVQSIADGEALNAANLVLGVKGLTDRTVNLRKGIAGVASSLTTRVPLPTVVPFNLNTRFTYSGGGSTHMWQQTDITNGGDLRFILGPTPLLGKVDRIAAWVSGGTGFGRSTVLPAVKPTIQAFKLDGVSGFYTQIGPTVIDPSATMPNYLAPHYLEVTGLGEPIVAGKEFALSIAGESGANSSVNGFRVLGLELTIIP